MTDRLLTAREVAERLRVCVDTVLRWVKRSEFEGVVVYLPAGALRFREGALDAWLEQRATPRRGALTATPGAAQPRKLPSAALTATDDEE